MDANMAMKFVTEYASRVEQIRYAEMRIKNQMAVIARLEEKLQDEKGHMTSLQNELAKVTTHRDEAHAFALSAIKSLTPQRGFVV